MIFQLNSRVFRAEKVAFELTSHFPASILSIRIRNQYACSEGIDNILYIAAKDYISSTTISYTIHPQLGYNSSYFYLRLLKGL